MGLPQQRRPRAAFNARPGIRIRATHGIAQEKLFEMAFCSAIAYESLERITAELKRNILECIDVLQVEEDLLDNADDYEKLRANFLSVMAQIHRKNKTLLQLSPKHEKIAF